MESTKYGKRRKGRWTPIQAKAQDTRANPNSWETHLVRKRWCIGLLRALSLRIMMMMMNNAIGGAPTNYRRRRADQQTSAGGAHKLSAARAHGSKPNPMTVVWKEAGNRT